MATYGPAAKVRGVAWTLYNYDPLLEKLREWGRDECRFMVFGYETCPDTGRPHLQGYMYFENKRAYPPKEFRALFPGVHDEIAREGPLANYQYCRKIRPQDPVPNEKWEEFGVLPQQGKRVDWQTAIAHLQEGDSVEEVILEQPHIAPNIRALQTVKQLMTKSTNRDVEVIVLIGPTGSGKSRWARDNYPGLYSKPSGEWWDGYDGEETILLDDFYGDFKYPLLLKVCDRYPLSVQIKGGFVHAHWKRIIITSNDHPDRWYPSVPNLSAFNRRVKTFWIDNIPPNANEEDLPQAQDQQEAQPSSPCSSPDGSA